MLLTFGLLLCVMGIIMSLMVRRSGLPMVFGRIIVLLL
jgi:hypothetical protein